MAALVLAQSRASMPAYIIEGANAGFMIPHDEQALPGDFLHEIITFHSNLVLMADADPLSGENPVNLAGKGFFRSEVFPGESFRSGRKAFGSFAKPRIRLA